MNLKGWVIAPAVARLSEEVSMAVLTIARELGAIVRGEELTLCNTLKLHCVSKATLEKRFAELGIERDFLAKFDECKPGIVSSMTNSAEYYWETLRTAMLQELLQDDIAVIGRGGNFLLSGMVECLRVRLIAPEDFRIGQVAKEYSISDHEAAKMVRQSDSAREKFCDYYYGKSWRDPQNYDLVINMETISMEELAELLYPLLPSTHSDTRKAELQLVLQSQIIKHTLFAVKELQLHFPEVVCDESGTVTLRGTVPSAAASRHAEEIVSKLPGVNAVNNELTVVLRDVANRIPPFMH